MATAPHIKSLRDGAFKLFEGQQWQASTAYSVDDVVVPTEYNGYAYVCTTAGTSDATEPTWPTELEATVEDPVDAEAENLLWECQALNEITVPFVEDGSFSWDESDTETVIDHKERGLLSGGQRRLGEENPLPLEFSVKGTAYEGEDGDTELAVEAVKGTGEAAGWESASKASFPHSVNVLFKNYDDDKEKYCYHQFPQFIGKPSYTVNADGDIIAFSGTCWCKAPAIWWAAS